MNKNTIEETARDYRERLGGTFFAFPIDPDNSRSQYAVTMFDGQRFRTYSEVLDVEEAATGLKLTIEALEEETGRKIDFDREVRFISHEAQMNSDSVTMRRLKKSGEYRTTTPTGYLKSGEDLIKDEHIDSGYGFTARGIIKFSYLSMVDDDLPKGAEFMDEYYKLLAMRKYGSTASHIKREVKRMSKDDAIAWIERTYAKYVHDDAEIFNIMQNIRREN